MSESTGAPGSVSPATRPDGPAPQRVPAGVRMSHGAEDFLSYYMRAHCNLHGTAALGWAGCPWSLYPSRTPRDPLDGWQGSHIRRRDMVASLALLVMQQAADGVTTTFLTVSPTLPAGSGASRTSAALLALQKLVTSIRALPGPWGRMVGTLTVPISQPGADAWTARPHLQIAVAAALVPTIRDTWEDLASLYDVSRGPDPDAVHSSLIDPDDPDGIAALGVYFGQNDEVLPPTSKGKAWSLTAVARHGAEIGAAGDSAEARVWLDPWAETQAAITAASAAPGPVTTRTTRAAAAHIAAGIGLEGATARADAGRIAAGMLTLRPHVTSMSQSVPEDLLNRWRAAEHNTPASVTREARVMEPRDDASLIRAADTECGECINVPLETSSTSDVQAGTTSAAIPCGAWVNSPHPVEVCPRVAKLARTVLIALMTVVVSAGRGLASVLQHCRMLARRRVQVVAPVSRKENCVHPAATSARIMRAPWRNGPHSDEVRPRARSPPSPTRSGDRSQVPSGHVVLTMDGVPHVNTPG
ncbi:hypothetical protein BSP109_02022 [Brevibacterium sp. Mu109]|nr:hypothetical protein BSP109_02022 [Brevibacterium sp. Mu109]